MQNQIGSFFTRTLRGLAAGFVNPLNVVFRHTQYGPLHGPFVKTWAQRVTTPKVLTTSDNEETIGAYFPDLRTANPDFKNFLSLLENNSRYNQTLVFYCHKLPVIRHDQFTGLEVSWPQDKTLPIIAALTHAQEKLKICDPELAQDIKSKLFATIETMKTEDATFYRKYVTELVNEIEQADHENGSSSKRNGNHAS